MAEKILAGGCLCGAVRYEATGPFRDVVVCHCGQCRKWHGAAPGYTAVDKPRFRLTAGEDKLRWYDSSPEAKRGFCAVCGSSLFWQGNTRPHISIAAGTLDGPTGLVTKAHYMTEHKGDFYELPPGAREWDRTA